MRWWTRPPTVPVVPTSRTLIAASRVARAPVAASSPARPDDAPAASGGRNPGHVRGASSSSLLLSIGARRPVWPGPAHRPKNGLPRDASQGARAGFGVHQAAWERRLRSPPCPFLECRMLSLRSIASGLVSRRTARRLSRGIPNPILRFALVSAATALVPLAIDKGLDAWRGRNRSSARRRSRR